MMDTFDIIIEAYTLLVLLVLTGLVLLAMATGFSPVDDWHCSLAVASASGALGIIGCWIWRDYSGGRE